MEGTTFPSVLMLIEKIKSRLQTPTLLEDVASEFKISPGAALDIAFSLGAKLADSTLSFNKSSLLLGLQKQNRELKQELLEQTRLNKLISLELEAAESRNHLLDTLHTNSGGPTLKIPATDLEEATAIILASDWHVGERVDRKTTNGLNEFNPDIATKRAGKFFANACKLIEKERHSVPINHAILWLGGDLITGYIHEELQESNYLSPVEESLLVQDLVSDGISYLLKYVDKITVICSYGNHGRTEKKKRISTGAKNSYEWLLYQQLAHRIKSVDWHVGSGYFSYLQLYDQVIRFHHGDGIKYHGGIGGVTVPLIKFVNRCNTQTKATLDVVGHFHTLTFHNQFIVNGSLIGMTPYAMQIGCSYERPQQGFLVVEQKHGITSQAPILVED
ncbi:hypothetical protein OsccyDRAFT_0751 [Leptolyngbyaceae cyanobacterium JSC-12]|nr:hypothetical protein OsccyDRAFT_0751 [Leptolyngbyaceae cyanobacterium JSC-12]